MQELGSGTEFPKCGSCSFRTLVPRDLYIVPRRVVLGTETRKIRSGYQYREEEEKGGESLYCSCIYALTRHVKPLDPR